MTSRIFWHDNRCNNIAMVENFRLKNTNHHESTVSVDRCVEISVIPLCKNRLKYYLSMSFDKNGIS